MTSTEEPKAAAVSPPRSQFGLAALLGCFVAIGMALAYLQKFDSLTVYRNGLFVFLAAALLGAIVGQIVKRPGEAIFWSVIISAAGYLSAVGEHRYGTLFHFAWAAVGATSGAAASAVPTGKLAWRMLASGLCGGLAMLISFSFFTAYAPPQLDLLAAPIVGALVGFLIEIIMWLERQIKMPRYVTASWLLCAVIIGNLLVPLVVG